MIDTILAALNRPVCAVDLLLLYLFLLGGFALLYAKVSSIDRVASYGTAILRFPENGGVPIRFVLGKRARNVLITARWQTATIADEDDHVACVTSHMIADCMRRGMTAEQIERGDWAKDTVE